MSAELLVREELNNRFNIMHGGAIMALADNLGGTATTANLGPGQSTTTIESKTNFFAAIPIGDVAKAEAVDAHTVKFTLDKAYAPFISSLTRLPIVDKKLVQANEVNKDWGQAWLNTPRLPEGWSLNPRTPG